MIMLDRLHPFNSTERGWGIVTHSSQNPEWTLKTWISLRTCLDTKFGYDYQSMSPRESRMSRQYVRVFFFCRCFVSSGTQHRTNIQVSSKPFCASLYTQEVRTLVGDGAYTHMDDTRAWYVLQGWHNLHPGKTNPLPN